MSICVECTDSFRLSEGEKGFYAQRDLSLPKRCRNCREDRKQKPKEIINNHPPSPPSLSEIYCDNCGKDARVPFKPEPNRKAYCRVCWNGVKHVGAVAEFS